jgi:hypothetical protein
MASPIIRAATREDIAQLARKYGVNPTMRAIVIDLGGEVIGIGGVFRFDARWYAFAELTDKVRSHHKMTLMRAGKRLLAIAKEMGIRFMYADPDEKQPRSVDWLLSLGFVPSAGSFYRWSAQDTARNI